MSAARPKRVPPGMGAGWRRSRPFAGWCHGAGQTGRGETLARRLVTPTTATRLRYARPADRCAQALAAGRGKAQRDRRGPQECPDAHRDRPTNRRLPWDRDRPPRRVQPGVTLGLAVREPRRAEPRSKPQRPRGKPVERRGAIAGQRRGRDRVGSASGPLGTAGRGRLDQVRARPPARHRAVRPRRSGQRLGLPVVQGRPGLLLRPRRPRVRVGRDGGQGRHPMDRAGGRTGLGSRRGDVNGIAGGRRSGHRSAGCREHQRVRDRHAPSAGVGRGAGAPRQERRLLADEHRHRPRDGPRRSPGRDRGADGSRPPFGRMERDGGGPQRPRPGAGVA